MEIRATSELGMKNIVHDAVKKIKPPAQEANLLVRDMNNKQFDQIQKETTAVRPSQMTNHYKVTGSTVNIMA